MITAHSSKRATIAAIATRTLYEIAPGAPVRWIPRVNGQVRVRTGRIWLTREGDARDYWLEAGTAMPVMAGDVLWASVEGDVPGRLEIRSQAVPAPVWRQVWRVLGGSIGSGGSVGTGEVGGATWAGGMDGTAIGGASCEAAPRTRC